jgi:hypothetical protein
MWRILIVKKFTKSKGCALMSQYYVISGFLIQKIPTPDQVMYEYPSTDCAENIVDIDAHNAIQLFRIGDKYANLILKSENQSKAARLYESIRLLFAYADHYISDDVNIYQLEACNGDYAISQDINESLKYIDEMDRHLLFNGSVKNPGDLTKYQHALRLIFNDNRIRKALACFYQAQTTYYVHLEGSYIHFHSRRDIHTMEPERYRFLNLVNQEVYCSALTSAYRGIEAIMDVNFRERIFQNEEYKRVINGKIPGVCWDTRYLRAFYRVRYNEYPDRKQHSRLSTMFKLFLAARNRAGHGKIYPDQKRNNAISLDLVMEATYFLAYLIDKYLVAHLPPDEENTVEG